MRAHFTLLRRLYPLLTLVEPRFVMNSAYKNANLTSYLRTNDISDCLEKPIPLDQLRQMLIQQTK